MSRFGALRALAQRWREGARSQGPRQTLRAIASDLWEFLRESTPARRKARYGDVEYDWDFRVDTTAANVGSGTRFRAAIAGAPYQPSEPALFRDMVESLGVDLSGFTFIDLGSGKGRALLLASEYPFRRIVGVELLPELHATAQANVAKFKSDAQKCRAIECICGDAREYVFSDEPLVVYLFNPLPEAGLERAIANLEDSIRRNPRPVYVIYHNPLLEHVLARSAALKKVSGTHQYSVFSNENR